MTERELELFIDPVFLHGDEADELFEELVGTVAWDTRMKARYTASFGVPYDYSQMTYEEHPMHPALVLMQERLREALGVPFNSCLLNYYLTGKSSMGFHSDDTEHLQPGTGIAIVSLGDTRTITYRSKHDKEVRSTFALDAGSLLYMDLDVQSHWMHAIKKQSDAGSRISLTWRVVQVS